MSTGEPDSGTGPTLNNNDPISNNEDTDCDATEKVTATTTNANYDNIDGNTISLKCDRCDNFETQSRALFLVHLTQCGNTNALGLNLLNSVTTNNNNNGETEGDPLPLPVQGDHQQTTKPQNHNRKLFECDVCNMKFSNGANMRRHKMRHTGVKPYECRVCQKRFFRKDHLAEHFTTHTKTLPYHCPICNRGFQRQIAMRAHFQNEHVGQHDLVKTCPLCSFRAGTMKSLRVHFFNRHGIDLDNPGPNAPSSLLLALDPTNASQFLPQMSIAVAAAAAAASGPAYSDSGDSLRSGDNATPPMHFLTPHVEISMADNDNYKNESNPTNSTSSGSLELLQQPSRSLQNGGSPCSPQSADSNSNAPSSSQSLLGNATPSTRNSVADGQITPSISLIPIKQEPATNDEYSDVKPPTPRSSEQQPTSNVANSSMDTSISPSSSLTSLIKVSPLKSLLREDLKRRICARANNRANRINNSALNAANSTASSASTSSVVMSTDQSSPGVVATTSNGIITSTGAESEPMGGGTSRKNRCLQCLFCGIEFPDQTLYFLHKGCHSESNPWKCNICGEQCNNVYEFNSHLLSKSHQ